MRFGGAGASPEVRRAEQAAAAEVEAELKAAKRKVKAAKKKFDPAQEAFARELKDRWLEQVLAEPTLLAPTQARYRVARRVEPTENGHHKQVLPGGTQRVLDVEAADVHVDERDAA